MQSRNHTGPRLDLAHSGPSHTLPKPRTCKASIDQTKLILKLPVLDVQDPVRQQAKLCNRSCTKPEGSAGDTRPTR